MVSQSLVDAAVEYARSEIEKFGLPTTLHFDLSFNKAGDLAHKLGADANLVKVGACLMDIKLGEAFSQGRLDQHVRMGVEAAKEFLSAHQLTADEVQKIINCIEAHHGQVPHNCLESEIVTNADCYRFIHPAGVLSYLITLSKRSPDLTTNINGAEAKLEEKRRLLSLDVCRQELDGFYDGFKNAFSAARSEAGSKSA